MDYLSNSIVSSDGRDLPASLQAAMNESIGSQSHFAHDDLNDHYGKSFQSMLSATSATAGNSSSSSKAVLAALRALQDKIRRLETERAQALDEVTHLRMQLKNQEIEAEHHKQRDQLGSQKSLQEARSIGERLSQDKAELELKLQKLEEKAHSSQLASEDLQMKVRMLEEEKHASQLKIRDLEHAHSQFELQIRGAQQQEKDVAQSLVWETKHHDEEMNLLHTRVQALQDELASVSHEKGTLDGKLMEMDQLVSQLLALNESLVAQLSGRPWKALSPPRTRPPVKKITKKVTAPPRAASMSTASFEAAKSARGSEKKTSSKQFVPVLSDDVQHLKSLHKMYADMARTLGRVGTSPGSMKKGGRASSSNGSGTANSKTRSTRISRKKQAKSNANDDSSMLGYLSDTSRKSTSSAPVPSREVRIPKPAVHVSFDRNSNHDDTFESRGYGLNDSALRTPASSAAPVVRRSFGSGSAATATGGSSVHGKVFESNPHLEASYPSPESVRGDLQAMIDSLENEFNDLNRQYKNLLNEVSASSSTGMSSSSAAAGGGGEESIDQRAQEIVRVIQKLHEKGEQLRVLKSPPRS